MILWLTVLNAFFTISTFFTPTPGLFAIFVLFNGAAQAAAGAYFQTSLIAVASLFGPSAVQAMMSGQAAVAVAVSGVQVISSATSVIGKPSTFTGDGSAEEKAAFTFFLLSTVFLVASYLAHEHLIRMPLYAHVAGSLEQETAKISLRRGDSEDEQHRSLSRARSEVAEETANALRIAKANVHYEIAVACVFMITLVSCVFFVYLTVLSADPPHLLRSPFTHRSLYRFDQQTPLHIRYYLAQSTSSFSTWGISWGETRVLSRSCSFGPAIASLPYR